MASLLTLEQQVIDSRLSLREGEFVVVVRNAKYSSDPAYEEMVRRYVIYLDDPHLRADLQRTGPTYRTLHQEILTADRFIDAPPEGQPVRLLAPRPAESTVRIPDPRLLGLAISGFATLSKEGYESRLLRPDREQIEVEETIEDGERVWKVRYQYPGVGLHVDGEAWMAVQKGGEPVHLQSSYTKDGKVFTFSVDTKLERIENGKWFPAECVFRRTADGEIVEHEIAAVERVSLREIGVNAFDIEGLGLAMGRQVLVGSEVMSWNGQRLVRGSVDAGELHALEASRNGWRTALFLANGIFLAVLAAFFIWRSMKQRV